jgi:hypothetical protein
MIGTVTTTIGTCNGGPFAKVAEAAAGGTIVGVVT